MVSEYEVVCHQQMLTVSIIPIRILQCQSGEYQFSVSVFDNDRKVFCPDYPVQKCGVWKNLSSSCSILCSVCSFPRFVNLPNGGLCILSHIHH